MYYLSICLERLRKITKNIRLVDVPAEIQTDDPPTNKNLQRYIYFQTVKTFLWFEISFPLLYVLYVISP
jgi:hypothetical protein